MNIFTYLIPLAFIAVVLYIYRPWAKKRYQQDAEIPFEESSNKPDKADDGSTGG